MYCPFYLTTGNMALWASLIYCCIGVRTLSELGGEAQYCPILWGGWVSLAIKVPEAQTDYRGTNVFPFLDNTMSSYTPSELKERRAVRTMDQVRIISGGGGGGGHYPLQNAWPSLFSLLIPTLQDHKFLVLGTKGNFVGQPAVI